MACHTPREILRAISAESAPPIYGVVETYVGFGMAADIADVWRPWQAGRVAYRRSAGGSASSAGSRRAHLPSCFIADAGAVQRWPLNQRLLPEACEIRSAARSHRQTLPPDRRSPGNHPCPKRADRDAHCAEPSNSKAEQKSRKRLAEMAHMNRRVALGEMSASIAHELNQPLGAIHNKQAQRKNCSKPILPSRTRWRRSWATSSATISVPATSLRESQDVAQIRIRIAGNGPQRSHR